jgi:hypothetical protein
MGIFSKLFGSSSNIEKQLERQYVPVLQMMGMPMSQAKSTFHSLLTKAKQEARSEGTLSLPLNLGDILLEKDAAGKKSPMLEKKRREGVRDEDIRWWMNRHELDRQMMAKIDDMFKLALFTKLREADGLSDVDATTQVKKTFPIFGDPDDTSTADGDDRPLPFELKDRVNIYIEKRSGSDPEQYTEDIKKSSSYNALIRQELRKGNV